MLKMTTARAEPMLFSVDGAAEQLSISRVQLYRLMREGVIDFCKIGTRRRISRQTLERYVANLESAQSEQSRSA